MPYNESKSSDRQIIVKQAREITRGRNKTTGEEYVMYQVIATKPDGIPIEQNLRTFDELPLNEVLDVTVTPFTSEQWGTSYTLKLKGQTKQQKEMVELRRRIERIEKQLGISGSVDGPPGPPPPPSSVPPPVTSQPTTPPPVQPAPRATDDIPF